MKLRALACFILLASAACGRSVLLPDASTDLDAGLDSGTVDSGPALPDVLPGSSCQELQFPPAAVCLEGGWFLMSRWTTGVVLDDGEQRRRRLEPVYLDSFAIDRTEVTRAAFWQFALSNDAGVAAPPADCGGYLNVDREYPEVGWSTVPERSGWTDAGAPVPGTEMSPVACVTRSEAVAYCQHFGGRLPTSLEFFRAVRGPYPSQRRFPWGDEPPSLLSGGPSPFPQNFLTQYAAVSMRHLTGPPEVATRTLGRSESGVYDLVGGVSEFMSECAEDLADQSPDGGLLIRPLKTASRSRCQTAVLVAGDNWYTVRNTISMVGVTSLFAVTDFRVAWAGSSCSQIGGLELCIADSAMDTVGQVTPPSSWTVESKGNDRRSWAIGFRCAYDL